MELQARKDNLKVSVALVFWIVALGILNDFRHQVPLAFLVATPIVFSGLIALVVPDKALERRVRIVWRIPVIIAGFLYSGIMLLVIAKGK